MTFWLHSMMLALGMSCSKDLLDVQINDRRWALEGFNPAIKREEVIQAASEARHRKRQEAERQAQTSIDGCCSLHALH